MYQPHISFCLLCGIHVRDLFQKGRILPIAVIRPHCRSEHLYGEHFARWNLGRIKHRVDCNLLHHLFSFVIYNGIRAKISIRQIDARLRHKLVIHAEKL